MHHLEVGVNHFLDQVIELGRGFPSQSLLGLSWVSNQQINFRGTIISWVNAHENVVLIVRIDTNLVGGAFRALPLDGGTHGLEGQFDKLTHRAGFSCRQDVVVRGFLLKHPPHAFDVVTGVYPVALGVNISKVERLLLALVNIGNSCGDFACNKGSSSAGRFVVEENTVGHVHTVGFTVVDEDPVRVLLGHGVGGPGVKGRRFGLRNLLDLSVEFTGRCLVELDLLFQSSGADGIEHTKDTDPVAVGRMDEMMEIKLVASQRSPWCKKSLTPVSWRSRYKWSTRPVLNDDDRRTIP